MSLLLSLIVKQSWHAHTHHVQDVEQKSSATPRYSQATVHQNLPTLAKTPACTTVASKMLYASKKVLMKDMEAYAERDELMLLRMSCREPHISPCMPAV